MNDIDIVKLIAFYFPQYHPFFENSIWWEKGFTEWFKVVKAKPNYKGHYQPHLPADMGYYDLRVPEVREHQANLAREYGIYGFCYYHYWFSGKRLMQRPFDEVLKSGKPFFPFCLCWANENWTRRWDGATMEVMITQNYSEEDDRAFIRDIIPAFRDERYIRVNSRPLLLVYRVSLLPNPKRTVEIWRQECLDAGIEVPYLCAVQSFNIQDPREYGFDAAVEFPPHQFYYRTLNHEMELTNSNFQGKIYGYDDVIDLALSKKKPDYKLFRGVMPSWDNVARRQDTGFTFHNSNPEKYQAWLRAVIAETKKEFRGDERMVFINAWNEWAEGAHLEPDQKYKHGYLKATSYALKANQDFPKVSVVLPVYNGGRYIAEALKSVYDQTYQNIELIVINDGSTDDTLEVITKSASENMHIATKIISQENRGAAMAINTGIEEARGYYINILNADDYFSRDRIDLFVNTLRASGYDFAFSGVNFIDEKGDFIENFDDYADFLIDKQNGIKKYPSVGFALLDSNVTVSTGNFFFKKDLYYKVGKFRDLKYCHDWDFVLQALLINEPLYIENKTYYYRLHENNGFRGLEEVKDGDVNEVLSAYYHGLVNKRVHNTLVPCESNWGDYFNSFVESHGHQKYLIGTC